MALVIARLVELHQSLLDEPESSPHIVASGMALEMTIELSLQRAQEIIEEICRDGK